MKIKEYTRNKRVELMAIFCLEMVICCNISGCGRDKGEFLTEPIVETTCVETQSVFQEEVQEETISAAEEVPLGKTICVYICGEVNSPGVYTFDYEARLCDAIELAGGFTEAAGQNYWNLAMTLTDSQMIYVPTAEEADVYKQLGIDPTGMMTAGHKTEDVQAESTVVASSDSGKVNINTADKAALMTIPGIGETRAQSILDYRDACGRFTSIQDITQVSGIKGATFAKIEDYITVD